MKHLLRPAVAATALAVSVFAGNAAAVPLTQLYFSQSAGFVDPNNDGDADTAYNGSGPSEFNPIGDAAVGGAESRPDGTYTGLEWRALPGDDGTNPFSKLSIESFTSIESNTNFGALGSRVGELNEGSMSGDASASQWNANEFWVIDELLQENNELIGRNSGAFPNPLWLADTLADFRIFTDSVGGTALIEDLGSATRIEFWETLNTETFDDCFAGNDPYEGVNPDFEPCSDRYRVELGEFAAISQALDGYLYTISFTLFPGAVTDEDGNVLGQTIVDPSNPGFIDVFTPELLPGFSRLYVAASWDASRIPAPSVLGLLSIGLIGAGLTAKRRKKNA
ncbi:MAG: PEP-CTERM sorting domain-containing protein [Chromatocurvus sp.]